MYLAVISLMRLYCFYIAFILLVGQGYCQSAEHDTIQKLGFFEYPASVNKKRLVQLTATVGLTYTVASIGLSQIWYADTERSSFHFFNDWNEWSNMDKYGHFMTAYHYSRLGMEAFRWTGVDRDKAIWLGVGAGNLLQLTLEIFDGYSDAWGFSFSDIAFNVGGTLSMAGQELAWDEQRIVMKVSTTPKSYSDLPIRSNSGETSTTLRSRTNDLFGSSFSQSWLKDYNQQTIWVSVNLSSFLDHKPLWLPSWLNVAAGIGAQNMFGGFSNQWSDGNESYAIDQDVYLRYHQYYLSLDIDLSRLKKKSGFLRTLLSTINFIKVPAPTLELTSRGDFRFHVLHY